MIGLGSNTRVFLCCGATDLRKSFDGLAQIAEEELKRNLYHGDLILFCNRRRNRIKSVYWDGSGLCLFAKRLEGGSFSWPGSRQQVKELTRAELGMLLEGVDFRQARHRKWYRRRPIDEELMKTGDFALTE